MGTYSATFSKKTAKATTADTLTPAPFGETNDGKIKMPEGTKQRMEVLGDKFIEAKSIKPVNVSPAFVLDTQTPDSVMGNVRAVNGDSKIKIKKNYTLYNSARVIITIMKNDSLVKKISDENKRAGKFVYCWDGVNEEGVKLFGDYEGVVKILENGRPETEIRHKFKVDK
jgi:hypothetical protein